MHMCERVSDAAFNAAFKACAYAVYVCALHIYIDIYDVNIEYIYICKKKIARIHVLSADD